MSLNRFKNTIGCPDCGRSWHTMEGLKEGNACPSDVCPSNSKNSANTSPYPSYSEGPWIAHNQNAKDVLDIDAADGTRIASISLKTNHIAFNSTAPMDIPEQAIAMYLANAALIVAAPDLFDAVDHVLIASEDGGDMDDIDFTMLRAAIAKAKTLLAVVYSATEYTNSDGAGFWSNANGWTSLCQATLFSKEYGEKMNMPISSGNDAKLVLRVEVGKHLPGQTA